MSTKLKFTGNRLRCVLCIVVFTPNCYSLFHNSAVAHRIGVACILFLTIIFIMIDTNRSFLKFVIINNDNIIYALILLFEMIYRSFVTLFLSYSLSASDTFDIFRLLIQLFYFLLPWFLLSNLDDKLLHKEVKNFVNSIVSFSVIQTIFSALVFFPATYPVLNLYKGRSSWDPIKYQFMRFSGTLGYPADFGFYLIVPLNFLILRFLYNLKNKNPRVSKTLLIKYLATIFVLTLSMIETLSRAAVFSWIASLFFLLIYSKVIPILKYIHRGMKVIVIFITIITIYVIIFMPGMDYLKNFMFKLWASDESTIQRYNEIHEALNFVSKNPLGIGSSKKFLKETHGSVESLWFFYLAKWGIYGTILFIAFLILFFMNVNSNLIKYYGIITERNDVYDDFVLFAISVISSVVVVPIFGFGSSIFRNKIPLYYYMELGVTIFILERIIKKKEDRN